MADPRSPEGYSTCEHCGEQMQEIHCKLICPRCGYTRDCSDP
jgi:exosome complex RNA-binding protein Csl4